LTQANQYRAEDSFFQFTSRATRTIPFPGNVNAIPAGQVGTVLLNSGALNFPIIAGQALKIAALDAQIFADASAEITLASFGIQCFAGDPAIVTTGPNWSSPVANVPLGLGGLFLHVRDEEWLFWNDYTEQGAGGLPPVVSFLVSADVGNRDAANPHSVTINLSGVVEYYEKQRIEPVGQQATLRTLREIPNP
jgi:hypothetical protein